MKINQNLKLPTPGRKASCDEEAFKKILSKYSNIMELVDDIDVEKDASINFDLENVFEGWENVPEKELTLFHIETSDGRKIPYIRGYAGGDWQFPVAFIIYLSDKGKLRLYTPKRGNVFNATTKEAIGEDEYADEAFAKKIGVDYEEVFLELDLEYDEVALEEDIKSRLIAC